MKSVFVKAVEEQVKSRCHAKDDRDQLKNKRWWTYTGSI